MCDGHEWTVGTHLVSPTFYELHRDGTVSAVNGMAKVRVSWRVRSAVTKKTFDAVKNEILFLGQCRSDILAENAKARIWARARNQTLVGRVAAKKPDHSQPAFVGLCIFVMRVQIEIESEI